MIRRPPRSTRTDTLFPYTTLFRSPAALVISECATQDVGYVRLTWLLLLTFRKKRHNTKLLSLTTWPADFPIQFAGIEFSFADQRSEERRVGQVCVSPVRSRWSP